MAFYRQPGTGPDSLAMSTGKIYNNYTPKKKKTDTTGSSGQATATPTQDSNAMLIAYMKEMENRQKEAANNAYKNNVAATNQAFAERQKLLGDNLNTTLQNLQTDYDASKANVNKDAQNSLQQAYINNMLSRKNLNQNMAAQGLSGGASETTMAGMYNNYGNARNSIQTVANENLGNLENLYNQNRNSAYQSYNDQMAQDAIAKAQYMAQFEADRQNALANAYNTQLSQMMSLDPTYAAQMLGLVDAQSAYTPTATAANNAVSSVNTNQGSSNASLPATASTRALALARQLRSGGESDSTIVQQLASTGLSNAWIAYVLNQLNNE